MSVEIGTVIGASRSSVGAVPDGVAGADTDTHTSVGDTGRVDGDSGDSGKPDPEPIRGYEAYDPGTGDFEPVGQPAGTGSIFGEPTKRGRRKGSKNKPVDPEALHPSLGQLDFAAILISAHGMLSVLTGIQELEMDSKKEADELAEAFKAALKFHGGGMSPQKLAYINLGFKLTEVYGSRAMAYRMRVKQERGSRSKPTPINSGKTAAPPAPAPPVKAATTASATGTFGAISPEQLWSQPAEE
jgi:hypothetical protein